jgi:glucosylceramidase
MMPRAHDVRDDERLDHAVGQRNTKSAFGRTPLLGSKPEAVQSHMALHNTCLRGEWRRKRIMLGLLVFAIFTLGFRAALSTAVTPVASPTTTPVPVQVWMTTTSDAGGRSVVKGLEPQAEVAFTDFVSHPTDGRPTIWVSETVTYQQMEGFGASLTDSSAWLLHQKLNSEVQTEVMQKLFDPVNGIGLSFLRNPMGASDFARQLYSYDDNPDDALNATLPGFTITHDLSDIVPLTRWARQLNPELVLMGTPWSAPGWMKTNGDMRYMSGGSLRPEYYQHYANYFVKYLQSYQQQGLNVNYISLQNEPGCCLGNQTPGMDMSGTEARIFLKDYLLPAMRANAITTTKILVLDYNWSNHGWLDDVADSDSLLQDPLFEGIAWHGYEDLPGITTQSAYHDKYPWLGTYLTEHSGGDWVCNQMRQDFLEIVAQMRNWSRSLVKWNLALNEHGGPTLSSNWSTCTPLVTVHTDGVRAGQVDYTVEYYTLGHLSKFVRPGAYRIGSSESKELPNVAFKNPDGSKVLIVYNDTPIAKTISVVWGTRSFTYTVPAAAGLTFEWSGNQEGTTPPVEESTPYHGKPASIPGRIEAEDYDLGGEGVAYHDTDSENKGGKYRLAEGVDIEACSGGCTTYDVGWTQAGEWLKYTAAVTSTDQYTLTARVASAGQGGAFHLESDGVDVSGPMEVPDTGGWQNWQDVVRVVSLSSGTHVLRLVMDTAGSTGPVGDFDYLQFELADTPSSNSRPYYGTPMPVPGDVQAEDFDLGREGVAYHDTDAGNQGNQEGNDYRRTQDVDIEKCGDVCNGHDVGYTQAGEWLKYTVAVRSTDQYTLTARVASAGQGGAFHLESDGVDVSGPMEVPDTGGWQNWQDVVRVVSLKSGTHVLRLVMDSVGSAGSVGNFNYLRLATNMPYPGMPAPIPGRIEAEDYDLGGEGVAYHDTDAENKGGKYRLAEGVDIEACSGGCTTYDVGWTQAGEWLEYTAAVTSTAQYWLTARVASAGQGGAFHLESDGVDVSGPMEVPDTGDWQNWRDVVRVVSLSSGTHVLRLVMDTAGSTGSVGNFDYFALVLPVYLPYIGKQP